MKILFLLCLFFSLFHFEAKANQPDSAYVFSYTTAKHNNTAGLHYGWSIDGITWRSIGPEYRFLFSDFGTWGSQKKLITPNLIQDGTGLWHCIWSLNAEIGQFAHAASEDLYTWHRQSYPEVLSSGKGNVMDLEVSFNTPNERCQITWLSDVNGTPKIYKCYTSDFKNYSSTVEGLASDRLNQRKEVMIEGEKQIGIIHKVDWRTIDGLMKRFEWSQFHEQQRNERIGDMKNSHSLQVVDAQIRLKTEEKKDISDLLMGIFFEDINYAADGGLYAELIQNRGFEYKLTDKKGRDKSWDSRKSWSLSGTGGAFTVDTLSPIHPNQQHYAVFTIDKVGVSLVNEGFDGIALNDGEKYNFSMFARGLDGYQGRMLVRLVDNAGKVLAEARSQKMNAKWEKYDLVLIANQTFANAQLQIVPQTEGRLALDMISLFPQKTFKGHKNGLRADLAQIIADMHPRFVRFPGGCVAHGDGIDNIYRWTNTVGPLETRKTQRNIWSYHQSAGLGYFEYFQFCEDIGAEPLPVLAAGVPCQNSSCGGHGQQGGIPMCDMDDYVQEVLDLIEWANGDKNTKWGKVRAEAGHPEPFHLTYIGIGNEDLITDVFEERFTMIYEAIQAKYPEIIVIGTVGPSYMGTDYIEGWELATKLRVPMVDEHYYQSPGWFLNNQNFYDSYDRSKSKVYLGEYAAHIPGRKMNIETALCEALHLNNIERNGDVVSMTSFAPLLAKEGHTQWNPDLIYFNNTEVKPTVDYYVQKLYGQNAGNVYIPSSIALSNKQEDVKKRVSVSVVHDEQSKDVILKLINLLPVEVNASILLDDLPILAGAASLTVLQGEPSDGKARPVDSQLDVDQEFTYQMPAFSLSVIRIKTKE